MVDERHENRKQRRIKERRELILHEAAVLFAQQGFNGTTTKEIAQAADLSEGTLYNYFESKKKIFDSLVEKLIEEQNSHGLYTTTLPADTQSFLDQIYEMQHKFIRENKILIKAVLPEVIIKEHYRDKFVQEIYSPTLSLILLQLQARGVLGHIRPVNHEMVARIIMGMLYGLFFLELINDPVIEERWDSFLGQMISLVLEGLTPV